jgi:hypothetical protein
MATSSYHRKDVRFADFTGDGKDDVFSVVDGVWKIVPGGQSFWQALPGAPVTDFGGLVVADFDGDGVADVARASGGHWQMGKSGTTAFVNRRQTNDSLADKAIGAFDGYAGADVAVFVGSSPQMSLSSGLAGAPVALGEYDMR